MKLTLFEVQEGIPEVLHANCYFDRGDSSLQIGPDTLVIIRFPNCTPCRMVVRRLP